MNNTEQLKKVFSEIFGIPAHKITDKMEINSIPKWDSLGHLNLISAIEENFKVSFTTEEIMELTSYKLIYRKLQTKSKKSSKRS